MSAERDQVWSFIREETHDDADSCIWFSYLMRLFNGWSKTRGLDHLNSNDVAPLLRRAGYQLAVSENGSVVVIGLRTRGNRRVMRTADFVPPDAMPMGTASYLA